MELTYTERNGIMYPDLALPEQTNYPIGKYGRMRLDYLKKHRRGTYTTLLTSCSLNQHLYETEHEAKRQIDLTLSQLVKERGSISFPQGKDILSRLRVPYTPHTACLCQDFRR